MDIINKLRQSKNDELSFNLALLPEDLKNKIFYYLSHPCADIIRDRIKQLKLDNYFN